MHRQAPVIMNLGEAPRISAGGGIRAPSLLFLLLGAAGVALVWVATPLGIGVEYDSYFYLNGSANLLAGNGFARTLAGGGVDPITHFPPVYSALLALGAAAFQAAPESIGRGLSAILFGANVALAGMLARSWTRSSAAGILTSLTLLISPQMLSRHLWAMSEPLYLILLLVAVGLLVRRGPSSDRRRLAVAGMLAGAAYLTRYVGIALVAAGGLYLLTRLQDSWKDRWYSAFSFGLPSLGLVFAWLGRNAIISQDLTNRSLFWHPPGFAKAREAAVTLSDWVLTGWGPREPRAVLAGLLGLAVLALWLMGRLEAAARSNPPGPRKEALDLLGLHTAGYGLTLLISLSFFDASTRLNDRILLPIYLGLILMAVLILQPTGRRRARSAAGIAGLTSFCLLILLPYGVQSASIVADSRQDGLGFNSRTWVTSETLAALEELPADSMIYTNEAFPVSFHTGRPAHPAPERLDPVKDRERPDYRAQLSTMRSRLEAERGALVLFHPDQLRVEMPPLAELTAGLVRSQTFADGAIYLPPAVFQEESHQE